MCSVRRRFSRRPPTGRRQTQPRPPPPSTRQSIPTAAETSQPATSNTAPPRPTAWDPCPALPTPTRARPARTSRTRPKSASPLSGLTTETTYHYRVVVSNANGNTKKGADQTYTPHSRDRDQHRLPRPIWPRTSATLNGSLIGNGEDTHYYFEWGPTASYGNKTAVPPGADAGSPPAPAAPRSPSTSPASARVTIYHYRIVATNGAGTSYGNDRDI